MSDYFDTYIECPLCKKQASIKEIVLENWKLCTGCQLIFCNNCVTEYKDESLCPNSVYSFPHPPSYASIPVEHLLDISKESKLEEREGIFISRLFFGEKQSLSHLLKEKKKDLETEYKTIRFREEQWRKFGNVLVKRKDGKFISWGQI